MATLLSSEILEKLEGKIREMEVGEKFPSERKMAEEFGISRNMLRESLRVLSDKGLIEVIPGKGAYVSNRQDEKLADYLESVVFDNQNYLMDIVEVRSVLEMEVCLKAAKVAFHLQIAKASHNSIYPALLSSLYAISERKFFMITEIYPTRVDSAQKEHKALIEAIRNKDRKSIKAVAGKHFDIQDILISQSKVKDKT